MEGGVTNEGRHRDSLLITVLVAAIDYLSIQHLGQGYCLLKSSFTHHIQLIVRRVVNHTPNGSL